MTTTTTTTTTPLISKYLTAWKGKMAPQVGTHILLMSPHRKHDKLSWKFCDFSTLVVLLRVDNIIKQAVMPHGDHSPILIFHLVSSASSSSPWGLFWDATGPIESW